MRTFASHNEDIIIRNTSSAGGVFSSLAEEFIISGGIVYGASFNRNWNVEHIRVTKCSDLNKLRKSKYVFSKFSESISNALIDLRNGNNVLFSGTPCQIAAIKKSAGENKNLFCVEVVCHGAPETKYWTHYLDELCVIRMA